MKMAKPMSPMEAWISLRQLRIVLDHFELPHFLILGTCLGAHRDGGWTPGADDIDIGFLAEDLAPKAEKLAKHLDHLGYSSRVVRGPFTRPYAVKANRGTVKLDLVGYILNGDERFCHSVLSGYSIVHRRDLLETYETMELFGVTFNAPSPVETYLQLEYGENWRTPKDDHRSRTRVQDYLQKEGIPSDILDETRPK